jgi:hypothetical protein
MGGLIIYTGLSRSLFWKLIMPVGGLLLLGAIAAMVLLPMAIRSNAESEAVAAGRDTLEFVRVCPSSSDMLVP